MRPTVEALEDRRVLSASGFMAVLPAPQGGAWLAENARLAVRRGAPAVVFLGDSILARFESRVGGAVWRGAIAPLNAADFAIPRSMTQNVLWQIDQGLLNGLSPRVIVLLVGTNNLALLGNSPAEVAAGVASCLGALQARQPHAHVLLLGLLPRDRNPRAPLRALVQQTNALLPGVAAQYHADFLDPGPALLNRNGTLVAGVFGPDAIHPTGLGYQILADELLPAVRRLLASR
ncbi:MAG TPA: GDSL-type esterase/lipase family protein [Gemmataceae bacterium]|nr:GDSL-type esterase/lipase family protein [Gemmataceae bacterium]